MVQNLVNMRVNMLFTIGGDGTLRGAHAIYQEVRRRNLEISVVGVPKTIDNDIQFVGKTFGFETGSSINHSRHYRGAHGSAVGAEWPGYCQVNGPRLRFHLGLCDAGEPRR